MIDFLNKLIAANGNEGDNAQRPIISNDASSGFGSYDNLTGGFSSNSLNIFASASKLGDDKLSLAQLFALNILANQKVPSIYFTANKTRDEILRKYYGIALKLHPSLFSNEDLAREKIGELRKNRGLANIKKTEFIDSTNWNTNRLVSTIRTKSRKDKLAFAVVDNIQFVQAIPEYRENTRSDELRSVVTALRELSREIQLPIIAISHVYHQYGDMSRNLEMYDLEGSSCLEEIADTVTLFMLHKYYSPDENEVLQRRSIEVKIAKNRFGACGTLPFIWENSDYSFYPDTDAD